MMKEPSFAGISKEKRIPAESFEILNNPEGRAELLLRMDEFIEDVRQQKPDVLVFLDKSARPLAWLFRERYKNHFPDEAVPDIRFVNIGSEKDEDRSMGKRGWRNAVRYQDKRFGFMSEKELQRKLMPKFEIPKQQRIDRAKNAERVRELQEIFGGQFSGKSIFLVDEISLSGKSLKTASKLFTKAFPDLKDIQQKAMFDQDELSSFPNNRDLMPWFKTPGLIGVFDIFDEKDLLAKRVDKDAVEGAKKRILQEKEQATDDLKDFVEKNKEELTGDFGVIRSELKENDLVNRDFFRDLEWIEEMLSVTSNENSSEEDQHNWLINVAGNIPDAILFLEKYEEHVKNKPSAVQFALTVSLLLALLGKAQTAFIAIERNREISDIESTLGDARKLRNELKTLANEKI